MVAAIHLDLTIPNGRSPIAAAVKYGQAKYAIEHKAPVPITPDDLGVVCYQVVLPAVG